jgi:hypothetical protein
MLIFSMKYLRIDFQIHFVVEDSNVYSLNLNQFLHTFWIKHSLIILNQ